MAAQKVAGCRTNAAGHLVLRVLRNRKCGICLKKVVNLIRGTVRVEITGASPAVFLNHCAKANVSFWGLKWRDATTLSLVVPLKDVKKLNSLAEKAMCSCRIETKRGLPVFLFRFHRRYALIAGFLLSVITVCILSQFILTISVEGNQTVSTAEILSALRRHGVTIGTYGPSIDEGQLSNELLLELEDLSWMTINLHGTRAEVVVREAEKKPEIEDESIPSNVVAVASGIISQMEVLRGQACFQEGDTVAEGDVLISGYVDLREPKYSQNDLGQMLVHANGTVFARTWRTLSAVIPMQAEVKEYTGASKTRLYLSFMGKRLNFFQNAFISYEQYDKISKTHTLTLPGGQEMPLSLTLERVREYDTVLYNLDLNAAQDMLEERLNTRLAEELETRDGTLISSEFTAVERDGLLTVTMSAECTEQIGKVVELEGNTGYVAPNGATDTEDS
ncbi:MAG: Stage sporulation protein [Oscillospiraceae bacterium]|nr:Stage sporulation protein [Oscillospiraceae bacterium]